MDCIQPVLNLIGNLLHLVLRSVLQVTCIFTPVGRGRRWGKKEQERQEEERKRRRGGEGKGKRRRRGGEEGEEREGGEGKGKKRGRRREGKRKRGEKEKMRRLKKNKGVIICLSALFLLQTYKKRQGDLHIYIVCNKCVLHSQ